MTTTIVPVDTGLGAPTVSPVSPSPDSEFTISCPASSQNFNCISAYSTNSLHKQCDWVKWVGNNAIFDCRGLDAGTYTAECAAIPDTNNHCLAANTILSYSVANALANTLTTSYFVENGLPSGASWNVIYDGTSNFSTTNAIAFFAGPGNYLYVIANQVVEGTNYVPVPSDGSMYAGNTLQVTFSAVASLPEVADVATISAAVSGAGSSGGGGSDESYSLAVEQYPSSQDQTCYMVSNLMAGDAVTLPSIGGNVFNLADDFIAPPTTGVIINGQSLTLIKGSPTDFASGYSVALMNIFNRPTTYTADLLVCQEQSVQLTQAPSDLVSAATPPATATTSVTIATTSATTTVASAVSGSSGGQSAAGVSPVQVTPAIISVAGVGIAAAIAIAVGMAYSRSRSPKGNKKRKR